MNNREERYLARSAVRDQQIAMDEAAAAAAGAAAAPAAGEVPGDVDLDAARIAEQVAIVSGVMLNLGFGPQAQQAPAPAPVAPAQVVLPSSAIKFPQFTGDENPSDSRTTCWAALCETTIERLDAYFDCFPTQFASDRQKLLSLNGCFSKERSTANIWWLNQQASGAVTTYEDFKLAFRSHFAPPQGELESHTSKFLAFRQREKDDVKTYYSHCLHLLEEVRILDRL